MQTQHPGQAETFGAKEQKYSLYGDQESKRRRRTRIPISPSKAFPLASFH
jgi:hypothetical protein